MEIFLASLEQGLIYAILAMGIQLTFKVLKIADMSVEGSFPFGALVSAGLLSLGVSPWLATLSALVAGILPGLITSFISIKVKVDSLLAGILTMTMFYSLNLKVNGKPNVPIANTKNIFEMFSTGNSYLDKIIVLAIIVIIVKIGLDWFSKTKVGYMLVSTGDNPDLVLSLGESPNKYRLTGLVLANSLVALSGSLFAQASRFADVQMGIGTLVIALASIIIGDTLFRSDRIKLTTKAIVGAVIYKLIGALALELGLEANDLKLINALIVVIFIAYNNSRDKLINVLSKKEKKMLSIKNIEKTFNKGTEMEMKIFQDFNLEIEENTTTAIIGPNGCGKSTLLNLIAGGLSLDGGSIEIEGKDISGLPERKRANLLGRVYQDPSKGVSPSLSILENLALADNKNKPFNLAGLLNKDRFDYYKSILSPLNLGLENALDTKVSLLSGGQRQSLSLLMACMTRPKLLLLDEHTAALDPRTSKLVMQKTKDLIKRNKMTTLIITHNMQDAVNYADRVVMLNKGKLVVDKWSRDITVDDLNNLYQI